MAGKRLRTAGVAAALLAFVLVPLAIWGATSLSSGESEAGEEDDGLVVEAVQPVTGGYPEIVVSLPNEDLNVPDTTGGAPRVTLECVDAAGAVEFRVKHFFPFTDTDGGAEPPHIHRAVSPDQVETIESCRLDGTTVELEGKLEAGGL